MTIQAIQTDLVLLAYLLIGFIVLVYTLSLIFAWVRKPVKQRGAARTVEEEPIVKMPHKRQTDEIIDTLEWMKALGIIDTKQFNELMVKCLPHLK